MRELTPLADYQHALASRNRAQATGVVTQLLTEGVDPVTVLTDVIATSQREVGMRWQRAEWTVADEHAATAISVAATAAVADYVSAIPVRDRSVLVACAEREFHELPAMIIACALRAHGWDTTVLGAATSPMRLSQHLVDDGHDAVAISCSVLGALPTTRRFIEAATAAGVPTLVGGPAFGYDDVRARALGATAWASSAHAAVTAMEGLPTVSGVLPEISPAASAEQAQLDLHHRRIVESLRERWSLTRQPQNTVFANLTRDTLNQALHALSAALLTGDPRPIAETAWWISDVLQARDADPASVAELAGLLADTLDDYPLARDLVREHFTIESS
ncbi:cobalamin B12-binding domain-containing protein [Mycolicibacterium aichiense]|uniref:Cobalamin-binding protein n=1 Tax=Mycolicibacterium aichiense TaxID=1799 RepID=A0AAD1HKF0_9MYCO|nr:cobalamin B12-binding domain-containing protein [Mycolicibacterium aichiense]MCV7018081.1 cobalamin B12-binding domain-containing protein [Mycolicibacterium aichiense]BBX07032.1 cobalamin-binding protein [Mycolicibacterium aichiense]STZ80848.1 cobalamin B12-binding domain-containing protein [Mycolicibacterium aichiense]